MNITITSRKFRAKESLKSRIQDELQYLERFSDEIIDADVILSFTHLKDSIKTAEVKLEIPGRTLLVTESSDDFGKSIHQAVAKLARQLKNIKSKRKAKVKP